MGFAVGQTTGIVPSEMNFGITLVASVGVLGVSSPRHTVVLTTVAFFGKHALSCSLVGRAEETPMGPLINNFANFSADTPPWPGEKPLLANAADQSRLTITSRIAVIMQSSKVAKVTGIAAPAS